MTRTRSRIAFLLILMLSPVLIGLSDQHTGQSAGLSAQVKATPQVTGGAFVNPVFNANFPDPDVLKAGDTWYAYATNGNGYNIQVLHSSDLIHWTGLAEALPRLPKWAVPDSGFIWAPEVTAITGTAAGTTSYLMYFVARYPTSSGGEQCIGTATSDQLGGPFTPRDDKPLICQLDLGGSIDPDSFVDADGTRYVLWKNDGNSEGKPTWLTIQPVSADGQTLLGKPTQLVTADQPWEGILVEAPNLWKHDGRYYLFYSANDYSGRKYAVGYAVASQITGPYTKPSKTPFLASDSASGIIGPGGEDITTDGADQTWMVFHSWSLNFRRLNLIQVNWVDGLPQVAPFSRAPQPAPLLPAYIF